MSQRIPTRLRSRASALLAAVALVAGFGVVSAPASASESGWLHTDGARIVTEAGEAHTIRAVSWFGLETSNCAPHGLWTISLDEGLQTIAGLGFNAIRLPYANECLTASSTSSIDANANPDLVGLTPLQVMDAVIDRASAYGLDVILDRHRPTTSGQSSLWYTSEVDEQQWIDDWVMLAERYADDPTVIGADLHNEPHDSACWGCGDASVDWQAAATRAGNAVLAANPNLLIIVEGVGRDVDGSWTWWGGGLRGVADDPVVLEVADRVVYSPHDYPASVAWQNWFGASDYPDNLTSVWDTNWGYIQKQGIAPVLLGEFGTKLETDSDRLWFDEIIAYLDENPGSRQGRGPRAVAGRKRRAGPDAHRLAQPDRHADPDPHADADPDPHADADPHAHGDAEPGCAVGIARAHQHLGTGLRRECRGHRGVAPIRVDGVVDLADSDGDRQRVGHGLLPRRQHDHVRRCGVGRIPLAGSDDDGGAAGGRHVGAHGVVVHPRAALIRVSRGTRLRRRGPPR